MSKLDLTDKKVATAGNFLAISSHAEAKKMLQELGATVTGSVSGKTDYLLCGLEGGAKQAKAEEIGTPILSELDLLVASGKSVTADFEQCSKLPLDTTLFSAFELGFDHDPCPYAVLGHVVDSEADNLPWMHYVENKESSKAQYAPETSDLETLLAQPNVNELVGIVVGQPQYHEYLDNEEEQAESQVSVDVFVSLLEQHAGKLSKLRALAIQTFDDVPVCRILNALPELEHLLVTGGTLTMAEPIRHAALKELRGQYYAVKFAELLSTCSFPKLTHVHCNTIDAALIDAVNQQPQLRHFGFENAAEAAEDVKLLLALEPSESLTSMQISGFASGQLEKLSKQAWWGELTHLTLARCSLSVKKDYITAAKLPKLEYLGFEVGSTKRLFSALEQLELTPHVAISFARCSVSAGAAGQMRYIAIKTGSRHLNVSHNHCTSDKQRDLFEAMPIPCAAHNQQEYFYEGGWE